MTQHLIKGKTGELLAVEYLQTRGYKVLFCNWRYQHLEIDIIASRNQTLHIVEVKTRHSAGFGFPEEAVSRKKFRNLQTGAAHFMALYPCWKYLQFDILSINRSLAGDTYFLIDDFYL